MVLLQLKGLLELFIQSREFLPGSGFLSPSGYNLSCGRQLRVHSHCRQDILGTHRNWPNVLVLAVLGHFWGRIARQHLFLRLSSTYPRLKKIDRDYVADKLKNYTSSW